MNHRTKATIQGIVQGIGFRPFIYNLAKKHDLKGYILNTSSGVEIEVEGDAEQIELFFRTIENNNLPLAQITSIERINLIPINYQDFIIRESVASAERTTLISPDICVCEDCLSEMRNPHDRRYRYPFINCTNCGPRYTIIEDVPYDRPKTSMRIFQMCEDCQREYDDPTNRRFHAQPNACPVCGPQVELFDQKRNRIDTKDPIIETIELLKQGAILAIKGLGGFHLAVDAENNDVMIKLRQKKNREEKPLAIMSANLDRIRKYAHISREEEKLLTSPQRPIVLLSKKESNTIAEEVAPKNPNIGVMLPYTPLHYLLLEDNEILALVMTSGNLSEEPIVIDNDDAFERIGNVADYFLLHNRDIYLRSDDSVVRRIDEENRIIRRSRGYIPQPIFLHKKFPQILACGAELKNTICLTKGKNAFISQHIGDLKNMESYEFFDLTIRHLKRILDIEPEIIAYDLHPDYLCTRYALEQDGIKLIGVQHHHAHIASCMLEHGIEQPVMGLSFDGTGYGTDGKIWGGEVLLVDGTKFSRLAHFEYIPMPGGDMAIKEPWRMAVSYLCHTFGEDLWNMNLPLFKEFDKNKIQFIIEMINKGLNCPETSSLGRLFDGISALLGVCYHSTYEGQAAIMLEMEITDQHEEKFYKYEWSIGMESYLISTKPIIEGIVTDFMSGIGSNLISYKFHLTLIKLFIELCVQLRKETGIDQIVLSGGVFQNATLLAGLCRDLRKQGFRVFSHSKVPTNDGGIALGQVAIAAANK
jgi:hydrogenase maturation protein HypF